MAGMLPAVPRIDPDIARAQTLPSWCYRDPAFFDALRERVLAPSWQVVAVDPPASPGAVPFEFLAGSVPEPLVLARDESENLRCLSNVCTHRGSVVATGPTAKLRCPYHGRRFALDGAMQSMPGFTGVEGFPCERDNLRELPLEKVGPLHVTALDSATQAATTFADVLPHLSTNHERDPAADRCFRLPVHWLLYVENFLEGFHIPYVHPDLAKTLGNGRYTTELFAHANVQRAFAAGDSQSCIAQYFLVFPNLMFNFYPWGLSLNIVRPIGPAETEVEFQAWVANPSLREGGASGDLDGVQAEDEAIVALVQRGMQSRIMGRGRYSVEHEACVHHFHRWLCASLEA